FDDAKSANSDMQKEVIDLKNENKSLKSSVVQYDEQCQKLSYEIQELKARSMQQNLIFFGLAEAPIVDPDKTEDKLRDFLKTELSLEDPSIIDTMIFDRVHRLGKPRRNRVSNPRPIVARFERYRDRETIRYASKDLNLKQNGFSIREQFPPEMEEKRKRLYPVMRRYMQNSNNRVALVRDRLYINGEEYIPPSEMSNSYEPTGQRAPPTGERTSKNDRQHFRSVRPTQRYAVETSNQFDILAGSTTSGARTGKRSLSSPEQEDTLLKRYRDHDTIPMDSIIEDMDETSNSQSAELCGDNGRTRSIEPGTNLALVDNSADLRESFTPSLPVEPVTNSN
ncbi:MAG: hypothetical protein AB2693_32340, partial [Candidatus Thiodiazotropha sp.]